jgi:hypothetical protein
VDAVAKEIHEAVVQQHIVINLRLVEDDGLHGRIRIT